MKFDLQRRLGRWSALFRALVPLGLCVGAFILVRRELHKFDWHDVRTSLSQLPADRLLASLALMVVNYVLLIGYDLVCLQAIGRPLSWGRTALASFTGFVTSYNFGALLGGTTVRTRLYSAWGLSAIEIVHLVVMLGVTFWVGVFALAGIVFLIVPVPIPASLGLPIGSMRVLGGVLLAGVAALFIMTAVRRRPLIVRGFEIPLPTLSILGQQTAVSVIDLVVAAASLYVLLPASVSIGFGEFLSIFLLAMVSVVVTHVPGGLGVLELVVLTCLGGNPQHDVIAALLAFRVIYYLLPLAVALALLAGHEYSLRQGQIARFRDSTARAFEAVRAVMPAVLAIGTMILGAILLFSGVTPALPARLEVLEDWLPLSAVETSHFLASLAGAGLLLLGRGLQRRLDAAWWGAVLLLAAAAIFSLVKGLDYEEAAGATILLAVLWLCRKEFYRHGSILRPTWSVGWVASAAIAVLCSIWLGMFAHKHVEYSHELWWRFEFDGDAPRFLRAELGVIIAMLAFALTKGVMSRRTARIMPPDATALEDAARVIATGSRTSANLALLGDKSLLFNDACSAFVMYGVQARTWVVLGDPVGPAEDWSELVWKFRELVDRFEGWPVFYQVDPEHLPLYLDHGLSLLKLGEEARIDVPAFSLVGRHRQSLRTSRNKLQKEGVNFRLIPQADVPAALPRLRAISDAWLAVKQRAEIGFSLGFFNEDYLKRFPCGVLEQRERIIAFANVWQAADREEFSIDLMRYDPSGPDGLIDYLFCELLAWGKDNGYRWFNLGMAPLSGIEARRLSPVWNKIAALVFRHGDQFYNFGGLRSYKEKFGPVWKPKYLAAPGGLALPRILGDIARLINKKRRGGD